LNVIPVIRSLDCVNHKIFIYCHLKRRGPAGRLSVQLQNGAWGGTRSQFDMRALTATNRQPRVAIREASLREDLYFRLSRAFTRTSAATAPAD